MKVNAVQVAQAAKGLKGLLTCPSLIAIGLDPVNGNIQVMVKNGTEERKAIRKLDEETRAFMTLLNGVLTSVFGL